MERKVIAVDAMSGDNGFKVVIPAAVQVIQETQNIDLILVGDEPTLTAALLELNQTVSSRLRIYHAPEIVRMDEAPVQALRTKKKSSMREAINLVKEGQAAACVSAGNTGALMATAHFVLKTLPGIDRSAIIESIPANNKWKRVRILDLGANVDSSAEQLVQFAIMGSVLTSAVDQIERPKVALLNIGEESIKGNEQVKNTAKLLQAYPAINYVGFIEGNAIFKGDVDVVVCDGFVGNVFLKTVEGVAEFLTGLIKSAFRKNILTQLTGLAASRVLRTLSQEMDPSLHNGASFLGLKGIVIKSHGHTNVKGFKTAIERAILEVNYNVPKLIEHQVTQLLQNKG